MMPSLSVGAVVTNFNSGGTVRNVLHALRNQSERPARIVVVDNGSTADDLDSIAREYPEAEWIRLEQNRGLPQARNLGLARLDTDYVLFLDDDVYPAPDCLQRMRAASLAHSAAAVCPRVVLHPADNVVQCDGAAIHFAGTLILRNANAPLGNAPPPAGVVGAFIGACLLIRRAVLEAVGGFDAGFFFYFEDMELSYRLLAQGHTIVCDPGALAFHDRGRGTPDLSFRGGETYPLQRAYYVMRHRWMTILLHYRARTLFLLAPALALYELASLAECARRGWLPQWRRAGWSVWQGRSSILARRRRWQAARRRGDREILAGGPLPFATGFLRGGAAAAAARVLNVLLNAWWGIVKRWI